jgi:hypothetical protein
MELVAAGSGTLRTSRLTMHVNKVHHITTISSVAEDFAVDEDWLAEVASEMDIEDGCIWVYGVGDDGVQAFTDDGIDHLRDLVRMRKDAPHWLKLPE